MKRTQEPIAFTELESLAHLYGYIFNATKAFESGVLRTNRVLKNSANKSELKGQSVSWAAVKLRLLDRIPRSQFTAWIKPIQVKSFQKNRLVFKAPNDFAKNWIN